jgi:uncharacterized protein DUF1360
MASRVQEAVNPPDIFAGYGGGGDRPLLPYAALASVWLSGLAGYLGLARMLRKPIPSFSAGDLALLAGATFHLSRLITKDAILSFVRAPFTRFKEPGAPGETNEEPRKETEMQHAIGELLSCPFCMATWVAAGLTYGWTFFPAATRLLAGLFCVVGLADALQLAYGTATKKAG